jgi:filamentous hemagglutinin family protein
VWGREINAKRKIDRPAGLKVHGWGVLLRRVGRRTKHCAGATLQSLGGVAVLWLGMFPQPLLANPAGEQVVGGAANFARPDAATLLIHQQTDRAVINWNSFSIANGELTRFIQPSSTSAALNRVVTANPSQIYGTLQANGQVFLINPGGVMVGPGGVVDVAGFVASTHDIGTEEFMKAGSLHLHGNSEASILNQGKVTAREGDVFLVAREVKNEGQLMAKDGTVGMVSGTEVSLQAVGQGNFKVRLMAAEDGSPRADAGGQRTGIGRQEAEIVNEGVIAAANAVLEAKGSYLPMAIKNSGVIQATGVIHNSDGTVTLTGGEGDVLNTGVVAALQKSLDGQKETGGSVLLAGKNVTTDPGSILTASGRDGGGVVKLRAEERTMLRGAIDVVGVSENAHGGQVQLLGEKVALLGNAKVDASGGAGGGEVLVGGDYLGKNPEVPNAKAVVMASTAQIRADATANGNGGKVILWSDDYTAFFGGITALGGTAGGNGGFIETSSAGNLQAFGRASAAAFNGDPGLWLLDPGDVTISTGAGVPLDGSNPEIFTGPTTVLSGTIENALNQGTSVKIQTGQVTAGTEFTISQDVGANIQKTMDNAATLTLEATGGITLNANILSTSNELFMNFIADSDSDGSGTFRLINTSNLLSNGGDITVTAADVIIDGTMNTLQTLQVPVTVVAGGTYAAGTVPTVTIGVPAAAGGARATATALMGLTGITPTGGGIGYSTAPKVVITPGTGDTTGSGAAATATIDSSGVVTGITITSAGSGYTALPTITLEGGGGTQLTSFTVNTGVVGLRFDGGSAGLTPPSGPSYGVGYAPAAPPTVNFSGVGGATATLNNFVIRAGNVLLQPSSTSIPTTIGVGTGAGTFSVTDAEIGQITTGEVGAAGLVSAGTITVGNRSSGALTVRGLGGVATNQTKNISLVSGAAIEDGVGGVGTLTRGLLSMETPLTIGTFANPMDFSAQRVSVRLDGNSLNLNNTAAAGFDLLHVSTAGITGSPGGINSIIGGNITYTVSESAAGDTTITSFLVTGLNTVDFLYENRSTLVGGGDIIVAGNVRNVRDAAGVPDNFRNLEIRAPNGTLTINNNAFINSGGGDITLASQDIFILGAGPETRPGDALPNNIFLSDTAAPATGWIFGGVNTFRAAGGTFGTRAGMNVTTLYAGQISGEGGVLTLEPTSSSAQGRPVFLTTTDKDNAYNLGRYETMLLEAPAIRIGGNQTADIRIEPIDTRAPFQRVNLTYNRGTPNTTTDTVTYRPRFFENPFFDYGPTVPPAPDDVGPDQNSSARPHVFGGSVSFVSALGEVRNLPDGDINVTSFSMTGVDGAFFDGRGGVNADYAGAGANAGVNIGSLINLISGRTGRTVLDETIGSGGDYSFFIGAAITVNDGRDVNVTSITGTQTTELTSTAPVSPTVTVTGGEVTGVTAAASGSGYTSSPVVNFYGGGIQEASARALLDEAAISSGGTSGVARVVPQVIGEGYTSIPEVVISGGGGTGAAAVAFINGSGQLSPFEVVTTGVQYDFAPTVQIFGDGRGAVARPILSNGTSGTLVGLQIVDPGSGYSTVDAVVLSGGGRAAASQAQVRLASGYQPANRGGQITPIYVNSAGTGYTTEPTVTLNGGGIRQAQATALVDTKPGSLTQGQVVGYQITDPGQGYRSAPSVSIGRGEAFGNFGEYGVSTEQVDRERASGNIVLNTVGTVNNIRGSLGLFAPVQTGNAFGVGGSGARSGSILLDVGYQLTANLDGGQDGVLITGDANVVGSVGANESARSGSITLTAYSMQNSDTSSLYRRTGSLGLPVQIGTAGGAGSLNVPGTLNARVTDLIATEFGAGDLRIYAPAPGELETAAGGVAGPPIDPNHKQRPPRSSNDLFLSGLQSDATFTDNAGNIVPDESLVTVEVGAFEGKLTLLRYAPASATATVVNGQVTLITPEEGGPLFSAAPTVVITGAGVVQAEGLAAIANGQLGKVEVTDPGAGYGTTPQVTITGGGGSGATAVAVVENGRVTEIVVTNPGFGYTSLPTITVGAPSGRPATATATTGRLAIGGGFSTFGQITSVTITDPGSGYLVAPPVTVIDGATVPGTVGFGRGAQLTAVLNNSEGIGSITIVNPGVFYVLPQITIGNPTGPAAATANLVNGQVESYTITTAGAGYNGSPSIFLTTNPDPYNLDIDKLGLFADRVSILKDAPASLVITASVAAVGPYTNQRPVDLISTVNDLVPGSLSLTRPDLQRFNVDTLIAGRRQDGQPQVGAGVITISTPVDASNLRVKDGIVLAGTRQILDEGGTTGISVKNLTLDAGGQILLTGTGNQIQYLAATIRDSGLAENASFTLFNQLRTVGSALVPLTIGEIFVDGAFATSQRFYQGITTQDGDLRIFTDQLQQTREVGFLDTSGGDPNRVLTSQVTLAPYTAGRGINLYATTPSSTSVLGLRVGNSQAPGLELVSSKGLVIGSGSLRDIEVTNGGFGYTAPPTVTITGGGGSGATAVAILDSEGIVVNNTRYYQIRSVRITNPGTGYSSAPSIAIASPTFGSSTATAAATVGAAGAITLNSNLEFNYLQYPQAPYQVSLVSGSTGSITAQRINSSLGDVPSNYYRVRVGSLTLIDAGTVSLQGQNDVDELSAILTGAGTSGNLSFSDIDGIRLGLMEIPGNLAITAGTVVAGAITQNAEGITVGGTASFTTGAAAITLDQAANRFSEEVSAINTNGGISIRNSLATVVGNIVAGGTAQAVTLVSGGGVTQSDGTAIQGGTLTVPAVMGALSVTLPGGSDLVLGNSGNRFTTITLAASGVGNLNNVTLANTGGLSLAALTINGNLSLTGAGISQTGAWIVPGTTSLTAGVGNNITLGAANDFGQAVSVVSANDFTLIDTDDLVLGTSTISGVTAVTAGGTISQNGAITAINGNSTYEVTAGSILLGTQANNFANQVVTLTAVLGSDVSFRNIAANAVYPTLGGVILDDLTIIFNNAPVAIPNRTLTGNLSITAGGAITQTGALAVGNSTTLEAGSGNNITLELSNNFQGPLSVVSGNTVTLDNGANALDLGASTISGNLVIENAGAVSDSGVITVAGTANFGSVGAIASINLNNGASFGGIVDLNVTGAATLTGITSALRLEGLPAATPVSPVAVGGPITLSTTGGNISLALSAAGDFTSVPTAGVTTSGTFTYRNTLGGFGLNGGVGGFALTQAVLDRFAVGTLALEAAAGDITIGAGGFNVPTVGNLSLTTGAGNISAAGPIRTGTLSLSSSGTASFAAGNQIQSLGRTSIGLGNFNFENVQGMNLVGTVSVAGNASLTAAGQFYDFSGSRDPFAGTTGTAVITSLSMFGGLPNLVSAVPGFRPGYFFQSPGGNRQMIYAVGPQTMNAPPGTVIAGVALGGTPTGGGQFDTFLTGSDNLTWIVADFGKFNLPKVEPARLEYMLYRQRVEPETRSLPQPVMKELTQELGRPPTIGEIQQREISKREAMRMRSGAILERSSFDEDVEEPKQEARNSGVILDGGRPQAEAGGQKTEDGGQGSGVGDQVSGVGGRGSESEKPQAKKQTDTKRDPNGPILRNGPRRAVALREEPLDPAQVVRQERERAEVGVAPPLAGK